MSASITYTQPNYINPIPQKIVVNSEWSAASITGYIFLIILWFIIIQFVVYKINKYYNSKIINDWWNHRGGSKYSECFNVDLINSYSSNKLLYDINTLFESEQDSLLKYVDIKFLDDNVIDHIYVQSASGSLNKDNSYNFLWPRHMCQSILFEKGEDYLYDKYLNSGGKGYPGDDENAWQSLVSEWCGPDSKPSWITNPQTKNVKILKFDVPTKIEWFDTDKHPDNIFARYKIQYDSPLVYSLCNNNYTITTNNVKFNRSSVLSLLGLKSSGGQMTQGGGWIGFFLSLGSDDNPSDFAYTETTIASDDSNDGGSGGKKCTGSDTRQTWLSGGSALLGGLTMLAFTGITFPVGLIVATAALGSGAIAMASSASSKGCSTSDLF
jgi:hypothetical protein